MKFILILACFFHLLKSSAQNGSILIIGNYAPICVSDSIVIKRDSLPNDLHQFDVIMFFSGSTSRLSDTDMDRVTDFLENGGGLYLGADNQPLQSEANQITLSLYKKECFGEFEEQKAKSNTEGGNLQLEELGEIPAGTTTVAFPLDYRLKVEAWVSDEPLILSGNWKKGRVIIDGGYSRFYCTNRSNDSDLLFIKFLSYLRFE